MDWWIFLTSLLLRAPTAYRQCYPKRAAFLIDAGPLSVVRHEQADEVLIKFSAQCPSTLASSVQSACR